MKDPRREFLRALCEFYAAAVFPTEAACRKQLQGWSGLLQCPRPDCAHGDSIVFERVVTKIPMVRLRSTPVRPSTLAAACDCGAQWDVFRRSWLRNTHNRSLQYWMALAWLSTAPRTRRLMTGSNFSWLVDQGLLPGTQINQSLLLHTRRKFEVPPIQKDMPKEAQRLLGSVFRSVQKHESEINLYSIYEAAFALYPAYRRTSQLLDEFLFEAVTDRHQAIRGTMWAARCNMHHVSFTKTPETLQKHLTKLRMAMARNQWGLHSDPHWKSPWASATNVLAMGATLATTRNSRSNRQYMVLLLAQINPAGKVVDTRCSIAPIGEAFDSMRGMIVRTVGSRAAAAFSSQAKEPLISNFLISLATANERSWRLAEASSVVTRRMNRLQKWLADRGRLRGLASVPSKNRAKQDDICYPSSLSPNLFLAEYSFIHRAGSVVDWQNTLFRSLVAELINPLRSEKTEVRDIADGVVLDLSNF